MAHNINFNEQTGQHSFFSVKQKAWHGLGQIVEEYPTSKEALQFAGLDYEVIKSPLFTQNRAMTVGNEGELIAGMDIIVPNYYATMRTDNNTVLGIVGRDYSIVQNRDAFSFFDAIVGGDGMQYETAGALGNGERIFITAKLPGYIKVGQDDYIEKYLFLTTSHDGTGSITAAFTPIRIVCQNTLGAALRNSSNTIKIRHTANAEDRLKEAYKVMGISNKMADELDGIFNQWTKVRITDKEVMKLIQQAMAPSKEVLKSLKTGEELSTVFKNICDNAFMYAMASPTQQTETTKGTLFGAFNAITGYFQNVKEYKDDEAKVKSIIGGTGQLRTQAAFDLCLGYAKNGAEALTLN
jgi:phage/plasmid-like protein (TIGR03299 family)